MRNCSKNKRRMYQWKEPRVGDKFRQQIYNIKTNYFLVGKIMVTIVWYAGDSETK